MTKYIMFIVALLIVVLGIIAQEYIRSVNKRCFAIAAPLEFDKSGMLKTPQGEPRMIETPAESGKINRYWLYEYCSK